MKYTIIHELPDRIRLSISVPKRCIDKSQIEGSIRAIEGIKEASFNVKTGSLLVRYDGRPEIRNSLFEAIKNMPISLLRRGERQIESREDNLKKKKKAVIRGGGLLLASPLIPMPLKPFIAFYGAMPIFKKGIKSIFKGHLNVDVLDSSAIGAAIGMGDFRTAGVISFLLKVGDYLEEWTKQRSRRILTEAFKADDEYAWVKIGDTEQMVNTSDLRKGSLVVVRTGGRIPVDGIVIEGEAMINQSSMTGEPLSVAKRKGLTVYAGTVVEEGTLLIEASCVGDETRVAKIVKVIEEAEHLKAEVQSYAERLADRIVPYTLLMSGLTYAFTGNPLRAASVLLVDYSCAMKLSTPLSIMAGIIKAAKEGVVIKGGKFIEKLARADVFVIDKTGTLTEASPQVMDVIAFNGYERDYILRYAACVEEHFSHPVASAVVRKAKEENILHEEEHSDVEYIVAHGIASTIKGKRILVGSEHFIKEDEGIDTRIARRVIKGLVEKGHSILYEAIDNKLAGIIAIEDPLRKDSHSFLEMLKKSGIKRIIMLTGDNESSAKNIAEKLGINEYFGEVLPESKADIVREIKKEGHIVTMVGDGINDSVALVSADVGISMKHGADIAKEACDVLLLNGNLTGIIEARAISQRAISVIKQNFKSIVGINSLLIVSGLLGLITPAVSAFAHNVTTVAVTANSLRISRESKRRGV
jgi:heavy metal translocating P-type ATPase